jgi:hypothetical protein
MPAYSRVRTQPARASNSFPQADSLNRLLHVLHAAHEIRNLDEGVLAERFGVTPRQGAYYYSAAVYVGLVYKRGGWIKPTSAGEAMCKLPDEARQAVMFDMILELPVFCEAACHLANHGFAPDAADVAEWVRAEDSAVNEVTAARRAETVLSWVGGIQARAPETIEALAQQGPALR